MDYIKSKIEFLERLYFLNNTGELIASDTDSWTKTEEMSISFNHRLMRSPLHKGLWETWLIGFGMQLGYYRITQWRLIHRLSSFSRILVSGN